MMACRTLLVLITLVVVLAGLVPAPHKLQSSNNYNFPNYHGLEGFNVTQSKSLVDIPFRVGLTLVDD